MGSTGTRHHRTGRRTAWGVGVALLALTACTPLEEAPPRATLLPFPTVTPGTVLAGRLPPPEGLLLDGAQLSNAATAVALANQPTATPDFAACPAASETALLNRLPETTDGIIGEIERFLTAGGDPLALEETLRTEWDVLDANGYIRADLDLTGEGQPDVLIGLTLPPPAPAAGSIVTPTPAAEEASPSPRQPGEGLMLILGCSGRRYATLYRARSEDGAPPELLLIGDVNRDTRTDLLFATRNCDVLPCVYQTSLITWEVSIGRFASQLGVTILSEALPTITDIDSDEVSEIVVRRSDDGTEETGPIRTGLNIYDWNGQVYVLSIVQPDPPRYLIQVIHEGDRSFARREMTNAAQLYAVALNDTTLQPWLRDETPSLRSYAAYRLLLAQAFTNDDNLLTTYQFLGQEFPNPEPQTVYVALARAFWDTYQTTSDLSAGCRAALEIVAQRPESVELLNLYGSRSPRYSASDLCPF